MQTLEELKKSVSQQIRQQMYNKMLSATEFAKLIGKKLPHVSLVLSGKNNFTLQSLFEIAAALGKKISIDFDDYPSTKEVVTPEINNEFTGNESKERKKLLEKIVKLEKENLAIKKENNKLKSCNFDLGKTWNKLVGTALRQHNALNKRDKELDEWVEQIQGVWDNARWRCIHPDDEQFDYDDYYPQENQLVIVDCPIYSKRLVMARYKNESFFLVKGKRTTNIELFPKAWRALPLKIYDKNYISSMRTWTDNRGKSFAKKIHKIDTEMDFDKLPKRETKVCLEPEMLEPETVANETAASTEVKTVPTLDRHRNVRHLQKISG